MTSAVPREGPHPGSCRRSYARTVPATLRSQVDSAAVATCNDEVTTDGTRETGADVISSGREPRPPARRHLRLIWLLVIAETVALAVSIAMILHYRTEVGALQRGERPAASPVAHTWLPSGLALRQSLPIRS